MAEFLKQNALALILLALGVAAVAAAIWLTRRSEKRQARLMGRLRHEGMQQAQQLARLGEGVSAALRQVESLSESMEARQDRLRRTLDERMELLSQQNERRLEQMRQTVAEKLDGRLNESFQQVSGQLEGVHKGLGEMRELALGVEDLRRMLGGVKTRGVWGEVQLGALMAQLFAPGQYAENAAIPEGAQQRVEFALRLPGADGGEALLPIDAKFPQEDYLRLIAAVEAGDREQAKRCGAQLERAVLEQARRIHDKYVRPPQTTAFAVMFLPTESLYAEICRRDGLLEKIQERYRVLAAGPSTLCALLTSLQMGLRSVSLEQRSGEVLSLLTGMKEDFGQLDASIQRMRQRLSQAEEELDALEKRARRAVRAMERIGE